jgi:hypothetical protein
MKPTVDNRGGLVWLLAGAREFSRLQTAPTGSPWPPIQQGRVRSSGSNCQTDHSPSSSSEVKNECSRTSTPTHAFSVCTRTVLPFIKIALTLFLFTESQLQERCDVTGRVFARGSLLLLKLSKLCIFEAKYWIYCTNQMHCFTFCF